MTKNARPRMRQVTTQVFNEQCLTRMAELGMERASTEDGFFPQVGTNLVRSTQKQVCIVDIGSLSEETRYQDDRPQSTLTE